MQDGLKSSSRKLITRSRYSARHQGEKFMTKSRALAFVGISPNIEDAEMIAETAVSSVKGPVFHREDIGTKELLEKRKKHMESLRTPV